MRGVRDRENNKRFDADSSWCREYNDTAYFYLLLKSRIKRFRAGVVIAT